MKDARSFNEAEQEILKKLNEQVETLEKLYSLNLSIKLMIDRKEFHFLPKLYLAKSAILEELNGLKQYNNELSKKILQNHFTSRTAQLLQHTTDKIKDLSRKIIELEQQTNQHLKILKDEELVAKDERSQACGLISLH